MLRKHIQEEWPKINEARRDLEHTNKDIERLTLVVENLRLFIEDSMGEDRRSFKLALMQCETALEQGKALAARIERYIQAFS